MTTLRLCMGPRMPHFIDVNFIVLFFCFSFPADIFCTVHYVTTKLLIV